MDKTTKADKLIRWQRVTIAVLLASLVAVSVAASLAVSQAQERQAHTVRKIFREFSKVSRNDEQVIRDLDQRLSRYELRFGEIDRQRKGEGVYIANPKDDSSFSYDFAAPIRLMSRPVSQQHVAGSADGTPVDR